MAFICNHCPFVQHVAGELAALSRDLPASGVPMVAISSNDVAAYPADSPEAMAAEAARQGWAFPYLYDEDQAVAAAYQAACTPDFFLFDGDRRLVYRGQLDASRPGNGLPVTGLGSAGGRRRRPGRPAPSRRTSGPASAATSSGSRATSRTTADQHFYCSPEVLVTDGHG